MKFFCFFFLSDDYVNQYASSVPKKTDEQSALNRILHETAAWVFVYFSRLYNMINNMIKNNLLLLKIIKKYLISVMW